MGSLIHFLRKTPPSRLGPFHGRGGPSGCVVMLSHAWQSLLATCGFTSSTLEINVASHTWAIHTWSWSVPQAGCFYSHAWHAWQPHGLAPEASSPLLSFPPLVADISPSATRRALLKATRGATKEGTATRGHASHAWRGSCQVR
jgi:hypothetical protein